MKPLSVALRLFLFVYVPGTAAVGLLAGAFQAPGVERSISYELFLWFVVAVQLLVPTFLAFVAVILILKLVQRVGLSAPGAPISNAILVLMMGAVLPTIQALSWGGHHLSVDWILVAVLPATALGLMLMQTNRIRFTD